MDFVIRMLSVVIDFQIVVLAWGLFASLFSLSISALNGKYIHQSAHVAEWVKIAE